MGKKIIALILVLPMILMMTLYTAVNRVSLQVKVPVSSIKILSEEYVTLDLDKGERYAVDYAVYPTSASNKSVSFTTESVGTQQKAELEYVDGYIIPKSAGLAYACFTTKDGSYRARVQVVVRSTQLVSISSSLPSHTLTVGQTSSIITEFNPQTARDKILTYSSSNPNVLAVNDNGVVTAMGKGSATITISSLSNAEIFDTIEVVVNAENLLSVSPSTITTWDQIGAINLTVGTEEEYGITYKFQDKNGNQLGENVIKAKNDEPFESLGDGNYKFEYEFTDEEFSGEVVVKFTIETQGKTDSAQCTINKVNELTASFNSQEDLTFIVGSTINWKNNITIEPQNANVSYAVTYSNENVTKRGTSGYLATASKMGWTKVSITLTAGKEQLNQQITIEKDVYVIPEDLSISESLKEYGIEKIWTIGKYDVDGKEINHGLNLVFDKKDIGEDFDKLIQKINYETSDSKVVVEYNEDKESHEIKIDDTFVGEVEITAKFGSNDQIKSAPLTLRCVGNGVEVDNFLSLHRATKQGKVIVLQGDIDSDFGKNADGSAFYQGENIDKIDSTGDVKYYLNKGESHPQVITLLQFRNNVYGNGYTINADNVTNVSDTDRFEGRALFNGPLNLVAMGSLASVKAQDNICFAVFGGVTLNNVILKGRSLEESGGMVDLTDLDYAGTVVEVLGDDVNIDYCRISNGRTVLRAFGDIDNPDKVINVSIKNSVLSQAREFIIRTGSNKIVRSEEGTTFDNYDEPYIDKINDSAFSFPVQQGYDPTASKYQNYEDKYIKTFLTIENSVLKDSGLFCIGIDSHFSGKVLFDATSYLRFDGDLANWTKTDGTSYGAKVTLNGDVRMYDWKNLDNVDSSSLIEIGASCPDNIKEILNFNIKEMLNYLDNTSMIYRDSNENQYVHGGIVFFGGGRNYGLLEDNSQSFKGIIEDTTGRLTLSEYCISLKDVKQDKLELAAGDNPFYFVMYAGDSKFNPVVQDSILAGNNGVDAYDCIYLK